MPLLEQGKIVEDPWLAVAEDAEIPAGSPAIVSLARLAAASETRNAPLGVRVGPATRPEDLAPWLDRVSLVAIDFPKFRDGRGFTIARTLRERYGFTGEIRALGHVLADQYVFLLRCGFTTVEVPEGAVVERWAAALGEFDVAYQPGVMGDAPLSGLRRRLGLAR
jgi:uncharacterized protein (DUF934 family)